MVGRWHGVGSYKGFVIAEASEAETIAQLVARLDGFDDHRDYARSVR